LFQSFFVERIAFYPCAASVCHLLFANKRIFAACGKMLLNGALGALLTAWGKADETADGKMLIVWIGCWRLIGCSAGPFG
jgi:hypothetical protein